MPIRIQPHAAMTRSFPTGSGYSRSRRGGNVDALPRRAAGARTRPSPRRGTTTLSLGQAGLQRCKQVWRLLPFGFGSLDTLALLPRLDHGDQPSAIVVAVLADVEGAGEALDQLLGHLLTGADPDS